MILRFFLSSLSIFLFSKYLVLIIQAAALRTDMVPLQLAVAEYKVYFSNNQCKIKMFVIYSKQQKLNCSCSSYCLRVDYLWNFFSISFVSEMIHEVRRVINMQDFIMRDFIFLMRQTNGKTMLSWIIANGYFLAGHNMISAFNFPILPYNLFVF